MTQELRATFLWEGGAVADLMVDGVPVVHVELSAREEVEATLSPWTGGNGGMALAALWKKAVAALPKESKNAAL